MAQAEERIDPRTAIAMGRRARRQSQTDLAEALSRVTGEHWTRVMVGNLEAGRKVLDIETLMAIAEAQDLPYSFYLEGPRRTRAKGVSLSSTLVKTAA